MIKCLSLIFISFITLNVFAQDSRKPMLVTDMLNVKTASAVTLTKDGSKAAFTVTNIESDPDIKNDYRYINRIWMVATDGHSKPIQLTMKEGSSQPVWSPDGKKLAFVRIADGKPQIFLNAFDGAEPQQITSFKYGATAPKWSPDGKKILFNSGLSFTDLVKDSILNPGLSFPNWPMEKPGIIQPGKYKAPVKADANGNMEEVRAYLDNDVADHKAKVLNKLNFQQESTVSADMNFNLFFITYADTGSTPVQVTRGFYRYNSVDFTPDGKQLIYAADLDSTEQPDRSEENEIYISNVDGSNFRLLLGEKGKSFGNPKVSPTGKWLAFVYSKTHYVSDPSLAIMPLNGSAKDIINIPFDRPKNNLTWSPDEKYLYFTASSNGGIPLYRLNLQTRKIEQLSDYNSGISSFDIRDNRIVFVKNDINSPGEIFVADAALKNQQQVSDLNGWVKNKKLSIPEKRNFTNSIGQTVEYWVMKPLNFVEGKKYPLLLEIHGGPSAMWGPGESSMWHEFQYFCSKGYGVVYCNPRGTGGYGIDFLRGNINDWGNGPASDILTALDKTVAAEKWADTSRLLVTGGSYAGYMVAWLVGHDHRFKAACAQRGVYDLGTFFGEGNAWRLVPDYFGGYPWQDEVKKILVRESPITYVQYITTPLIIFHGESDLRTGVIQGETLYKSLKVLGRPVEYVRHPGATHELTRSGNNRQRIDQMLRTWEFFERWIN